MCSFTKHYLASNYYTRIVKKSIYLHFFWKYILLMFFITQTEQTSMFISQMYILDGDQIQEVHGQYNMQSWVSRGFRHNVFVIVIGYIVFSNTKIHRYMIGFEPTTLGRPTTTDLSPFLLRIWWYLLFLVVLFDHDEQRFMLVLFVILCHNVQYW